MLKRLICWWTGCDPDYSAQFYDHDSGWSEPPCRRCGAEFVSYADCIGETRHNRFKDACHYWLLRKWIPAKCPDCGSRRGPCDNCIPF